MPAERPQAETCDYRKMASRQLPADYFFPSTSFMMSFGRDMTFWKPFT